MIYKPDPKEIILSSAKEIALKQGVHKINIRKVAIESGVSIGTVYNYYSTKADLLVAVIESFWSEVFKQIDFSSLEDQSFYEKIQEIYHTLYTYLHKFKKNWLTQISLLTVEEKSLGRKKEKAYFSKINTMIISLMDQEESIPVWTNGITKEKIAEFIFDNMLLMLKKDERNIEFFIEILKKIMS